MKAKIRIATKEYCYVEPEVEGTPEEIMEIHDTLYLLATEREGLNTHDWARVRNTYILKNEIDEEDFNALSKAQRFVINEVKKTFKSIKE